MTQQKTTWQKIARRIRVPLGFLFAAAFLVFAHPSPRSLALSLLLVLPGVWLRAYASGYVKKNQELATTGPYAHTRNPLYLGSMLIAFGFGAAAHSWPILIGLAAGFLAIYLPVIKGEEAYLRANFPTFDAYTKAVPRLLPRLTPAPTQAAAGTFSPALYRKHREYQAAMGAAAIYAALILRLFWHTSH